ncbi:MAG TPA: hypothetical protein PKD86_02870 [Gemmatales bacterium]|nr:hypothetical protein [Gemmatales bacterium]HMP58274.1 hypothetical protein [Gemmatales bacterium]
MTVGTGIVQIQEALKLLRAQWEETQRHWNDPVGREFERIYLDNLELQVKQTRQAMEQLANLLQQAHQDSALT